MDVFIIRMGLVLITVITSSAIYSSEEADYNLLLRSIESQQLEPIKRLLPRINVNHVNPYESALHRAVRTGNINIVKLLLMYNARVDLYNFNGLTPLHIATQQGMLDIVIALLAYNASIDMPDLCGNTALHWACIRPHTNFSIIKLLLDERANPNILTKNNFTQPWLRRFLLTLSRSRNYGQSPLHNAISNNSQDEPADRAVNLLLQHGANPNQQNELLQTPLHLANLQDNPHLIEILIAHRANTAIPDNHGKTALVDAISKKKTPIITAYYKPIKKLIHVLATATHPRLGAQSALFLLTQDGQHVVLGRIAELLLEKNPVD